MIELLQFAVAVLLAIVIALVVSQLLWARALERAERAEAWWRKRALTPAPVRPPSLPQPAEPYWSRAATVCAPLYQAPRE